ncbi:type II toxin-antitoxin system VapC family toxin [Jiangella anatolica]|uniref:Ribonuclease VapC n=1 Tax=Jiangella anatolica TaxID=2670374 RepID=A0A2W2BL70_9ACTN|nr:type II toxin-antitoxin system VapC family toxin [Jiangella anatolica]PZF81054.1 VapC toxin family PIN domain ribonuclease [Jiangella anatolica]
MLMPDVNILVYAHRGDLPQHERHRDWLQGLVDGMESYAVCDVVIGGFLRLVTNRRVFRTPTPLHVAVQFADLVRHRPQAIVVAPGARHWPIFDRLCREVGAVGRDVPDAYLAALAIEHGCEFVTTDKGFARFAGLRSGPVPA